MAELIHQFGIDWRLLVAQAVNFGILFFILYRFAYRPILAVLAKRKEKIQEGLEMREEAEIKLAEADREKEALLRKAEADSLVLITKAEASGRQKGEKAITDAFKKREEIIREGKARAEEEKRIARDEFSKEAAEVVRLAVSKVANLSPEAFDEALIKKAMEELKQP